MLLRPAQTNELDYIRNLYDVSFPKDEKKPFSLILEKTAEGLMEILILIKDNSPVGLMITLQNNDLVLLDYFAIDTMRRGEGLGSVALDLFRQRYSGKRCLLEIEIIDDNAENALQRRQRKNFYLKNGLYETNIWVTLFGVDMEILIFDNRYSVSYEEYYNIYQAMGKKIADRLKRYQNKGQ